MIDGPRKKFQLEASWFCKVNRDNCAGLRARGSSPAARGWANGVRSEHLHIVLASPLTTSDVLYAFSCSIIPWRWSSAVNGVHMETAIDLLLHSEQILFHFSCAWRLSKCFSWESSRVMSCSCHIGHSLQCSKTVLKEVGNLSQKV